MDARLLEVARAAKGFMPDEEGLALHHAGRDATTVGPLLEIGRNSATPWSTPRNVAARYEMGDSVGVVIAA